MFRACRWVLLGAGVLAGLAQTPSHPPAARAATPARVAGNPASNSFAAEPVVVERLDTVYRYNADGTGTRVEATRVRIQNDAGARAYAFLSLPFSAETSRAEFVSVHVGKRGGAAVDTSPGEAQDQPAAVTQAVPFYSDLHVLVLPVKGLAAGDVLQFETKISYTTARAPGQFWGAEAFSRPRVILERTVEVHVPASKEIQTESGALSPRTTEARGEKVYTWTGAQLHPTVRSAPARSGAADSSQEEAPDLAERPIGWTSFRSWAEMGAWYGGLLTTRLSVTPSVKAKADQVAYGARTPRARAEALYTFVSREIRSINVALGQGSYEPHSAGEVLGNQYGDSKDKAVLLTALLRAEGIAADPALVATGAESKEHIPSPFWFNEFVTVAHLGAEGDMWLDPMLEVAPFGILPEPLRDQQALLLPSQGEATLHTTPVDLPFAATARFNAEGTLNAEGHLEARVSLVLRGDQELLFRTALHTYGPAQNDHVAEVFTSEAGLHGTVSGTVTDAPEEIAKPLHVSFGFDAAPYGDWSNFRIVPLEPGLKLPYADRKTAPGHDIPLGGKRTETATSRLVLPSGFSADLPAAVHLHTAFADLDKTYRIEKSGDASALVSERTYVVKTSRLPVAEWTGYRAFVDGVRESEPWVQLTSAVAGGEGHRPPPSGADNPAAAHLLEEAQMALQRKDVAGATAKLDQAKAMHARQPFLWSLYGAVAEIAGKNDEALDDFRKEVAYHPEEGAVSQHLAGLLAARGDVPGAVQVLRAAHEHAPHDQRTTKLLGDLLRRTDLPAAEALLRQGLKSSPDDVELKLLLGKVLLAEHKKDEGIALLTAVATTADEPGALNDAAYTLADAGANLRVAESAARRAVQLLNLASTRRDNFPDIASALRFTLRLTASWDTYGWVLLKEGNLSEAEPWLRAAWLDTYGQAAGNHWGLLLQKQGRGAEAARVLQLAAGAERGDDADLAAGGEAADAPGARGKGAAANRGWHSFPVARIQGGGEGTALFDLEYSLNSDPVAYFRGGTASLAGMTEALSRVDTQTQIPAGTVAHLLRRGELVCGSGATCTLTLFSPRAALQH